MPPLLVQDYRTTIAAQVQAENLKIAANVFHPSLLVKFTTPCIEKPYIAQNNVAVDWSLIDGTDA